jgi:RNA ligase (TIGR02306 family)
VKPTPNKKSIFTSAFKNMDASIEIISKVWPHPDADRLDLAQILGFQCVVEKGIYKGGEKIVYVRPDALLPLEPWAEEYRKYSPKRIKAVKLRGEWSEGVIVPLSKLPVDFSKSVIGTDVAEQIGVTHYEPPVPSELNAIRALPFGIPKTDEERWENIVDLIPWGETVDVTLKIDGQSWSIYYNMDTKEFGVLGRSLEYALDAENRYSVHLFRSYPNLKQQFIDYCIRLGKSLCLRGESYGQGVQNSKTNPHSKLNPNIAIFSCYIISERRYAQKGDPLYFINVCADLGLPTVPVLEKDVVLTPQLVEKYSKGIEKINGQQFEGVVIKHSKGSFKVMSKAYDTQK